MKRSTGRLLAVLLAALTLLASGCGEKQETPDGAPNYATDIIGTLFYRYGVAGQHPVGIPEPGVGAAISTTVFLILLSWQGLLVASQRPW